MKKLYGFLLIMLCLLLVTGCGKEEKKEDKKEESKEPKSVMETDTIKINGIYVDESFEDENLSLVYMFYTVNSNDTNISVSSKDITLLINDKNEYSATNSKDFIPYYTKYYYSDFLETLYVGSKLDICATFKVAKGDLVDGRSVKLKDYDIKDISNIKFTTNDIKKMENIEKISEDLDKETFDKKYNERKEMLTKVDSATDKKIKKLINGYYWTFYPTIGTSIKTGKLEFSSPNKFKITLAGLSNNGTYTVRKGAIVLYYPSNKSEVIVPYELENGDVTLSDLGSIWSTYIDYEGAK